MRLIRSLLAVLFIPSAAAAAVGGGGIVGNGAGLAEQNVLFAYAGLETSIKSCLLSPLCDPSPSEKDLLARIRRVLSQNMKKKEPIVFVSGKANPGFFDLSESEAHRIAKTGLTPEHPIWINSDLLYRFDGREAMDFPAITAILIHEMGHQAGELNHSVLDLIGAKVRLSLQLKQAVHDFDWHGRKAAVQILNYDHPTLHAGIYFTFAERRDFVTPYLIRDFKCPGDGLPSLGFEILNGHWEEPRDLEAYSILPFRAWVRFHCLANGMATPVRAGVVAEFTFSRRNGEWSYLGFATKQVPLR